MDQTEEKKWFVFIGDKHEGPFSLDELQTQFTDGLINSSSFVWAEGMADWVGIIAVPELSSILGTTKQAVPPPMVARDSQQNEPMISLRPSKSKGNVDPFPLDHIEAAPINAESKKQAPVPDHVKIEAAWRRRARIRRAAVFIPLLAIAGGAGYGQYTGQLRPWMHQIGITDSMVQSGSTTAVQFADLTGDFVISASNATVDYLRPKLVELSDQYPFLAKVISPLPHLDDVGTDDYESLKAAAKAKLANGGMPSLAVALSQGDLINPSFYVASDLPNGAQFDVYVEGIPDTLIGRLHVMAKTSVSIQKRLGKSQAIVPNDGKGLPRGQYIVSVTESMNQPPDVKAILAKLQPLNAAGTDRLPAGLKLLARKDYFLGGRSDPSYSAKLKEFHDKLRAQASLEIADLKRLTDALNAQMLSSKAKFKQLKQGRSLTAAKKKSWMLFDQQWTKQQAQFAEPFQKAPQPVPAGTPGNQGSREEYFYADVYDLLKQADQTVQKLHGLHNDFFGKAPDERSLEIQLGEADSVAQSAMVALQTRIGQIDKAPVPQNGMPPHL